MLLRTGISLPLLACYVFLLLNVGVVTGVHAEPSIAEQILQQTSNKIHGKVIEVIQGAGYTYAQVDTGTDKVWAAASSSTVKVGDTISFSTEMPMTNFHSNSMNRDFPLIYFVSKFNVDDGGSTDPAASTASPHGNIKPSAPVKMVEGIEKVEGGNTIAELYSNKKELSGKSVRVRGKVTKYTANVMGKNWIHIRDSSTLEDLTVTTSTTVDLEDVVIVEGKLIPDKDFGYGYVYPLIVEDASVKKE